MSRNWNQPICERCWVGCDPGFYDPPPGLMPDPDGGPDDFVLRPPVRVVRIDSPRRCAFCGNPTWAGIFLRHDPATVPFPAEEYADE